MNNQTDSQLLRAYAEHRAEPAFAELVRRHVDFVYSAGLRMVCDSHLAKDVTQGVFVALAKNAVLLADRPVLSGWLHRTAQNIAAQTVRTDVRRRAREQEAAAMNELVATETDDAWERIAPHLDAALGELSEPDRDALLLRYFERKSASEMAQTLGISDEAAQKRVSRAVERLREFFSKRNVTIGASGLAVLISANAVQSAPIGLAATISAAAAVLAGTAVHTSTLIAATKTIAMTTLQKTLITATLAVVAGAGIYEARQAAQLREQNQTLQQQQAPLAEQLQLLQRERDDATNRLAALREQLATNEKNNLELLKLRGEVGVLRRQLETRKDEPPVQVSAQNKIAVASPHSTGQYIIVGELAFVGYATPEAALESFKWALIKGTLDQANDAIPAEMRDKTVTQQDRDDFTKKQAAIGKMFTGFQIIAKKVLNEDKVEFKVKDTVNPEILKMATSDPPPEFTVVPVIKNGDEWKTGGARSYSAEWDADGKTEVFIK